MPWNTSSWVNKVGQWAINIIISHQGGECWYKWFWQGWVGLHGRLLNFCWPSSDARSIFFCKNQLHIQYIYYLLHSIVWFLHWLCLCPQRPPLLFLLTIGPTDYWYYWLLVPLTIGPTDYWSYWLLVLLTNSHWLLVLPKFAEPLPLHQVWRLDEQGEPFGPIKNISDIFPGLPRVCPCWRKFWEE